jgi:hypothetical protein
VILAAFATCVLNAIKFSCRLARWLVQFTRVRICQTISRELRSANASNQSAQMICRAATMALQGRDSLAGAARCAKPEALLVQIDLVAASSDALLLFGSTPDGRTAAQTKHGDWFQVVGAPRDKKQWSFSGRRHLVSLLPFALAPRAHNQDVSYFLGGKNHYLHVLLRLIL